MAKKERRLFTDEERKKLTQMGAIRLPLASIAAIFDISESTLKEMLKKDDEAHKLLEKGRASASNNVRARAYEQAMGGNTPMLMFWLKTQEGFRETDRIELTGADGGPMKFADLSPDQRKAKLNKLLSIRDRAKKSGA